MNSFFNFESLDSFNEFSNESVCLDGKKLLIQSYEEVLAPRSAETEKLKTIGFPTNAADCPFPKELLPGTMFKTCAEVIGKTDEIGCTPVRVRYHASGFTGLARAIGTPSLSE